MLALIAAAFAHSPHDVCPTVARGPDGVVLAGETDDLARFHADGTVDAHLPSPGDTPVCLASLGAGSWALVTAEGGAWRSDDDGARWTRLDADARACAQGEGGAFLGGAGVWWVPGVPGADAERIAEESAAAVAEGPDGVFALDPDGALVRVEGWTVVHPGPWRALAGGAALLLGGEGGVFAWEDAPVPAGGPTDVVAVAAGEDVWLAAGPAGGVWARRDGAWTEHLAGIEAHTSGSGSPGDGVYWAGLLADGDEWLAAAWEGLYRRAADDTRWEQLELRTSPFVRGLAWLDDGTLLIAPYGAGLARGTPGEDDWVDAAPSLGWPWLRDVLATEGGAGRWFAVGGQHLYVSDDAGASWAVAHTGLDLAGDVVAVAPAWPNDAQVWAGGVDPDGAGALATSADRGATWAITPLGCRDKPSALAVDAEGAWVACGSGVWRVEDGRAEDVTLPPALAAGAILVLSDTDGLVVGGDGGLWRLEADGAVPLYEGRVRAGVEDGTGWVISTDDGLVRVAGGVTPLGWPEGDLVASLAVAADGALAAGAFTGAWTSRDGGATWALATDRDRYDDRDATWFYWAWSSVDDGTAKSGGAMRGEAGAVAEWRLEGTALLVYARGEGTLLVEVDGVAEEAPVRGAEWAVVWSAALDAGRHAVRVEVLDGEVWLDGGVRWRAPGVVPPAAEGVPAPEEPPCGCGGGSALLLALGGLVGRRRR